MGLEFEVVVTDVEELTDGDPAVIVVENARRKALAGAREGALTIGCDTDVALEGKLLGKPGDEDQAGEYLRALSGRTHEVLSGLVLAERPEVDDTAPTQPGSAVEVDSDSPQLRTGVARSAVTFHTLEAASIDRYLASGEWRGRAGGYAIQGLGSTLVAGVEGDISNVIGLPVGLLLDLAPELAGGAAVPGRSGP